MTQATVTARLVVRHILTVYIHCLWGCGMFDKSLRQCPTCLREVVTPRA